MKENIWWLEEAIKLYEQDYSYLKIGKILGVDRKKVSKILQQNGYNPKYSFETTGGVTREKKVWRKYSFNENYFETIDTEHKAYWLGFLYADGYVNSKKSSFELRVQESDLKHLEKFRDDIEGNMPIRLTTKTVDNKTYKGYSIQVNSVKFKNDLIKQGCLENKSLILKFPTENQVPKDLIHHFIRGYIDGDGSYVLKKNKYVGKKKTTISYSISVEIAGTYDFCEGYIKALKLHKNTIHPLHKENDITKRVLYSGPYGLQIINTIYNDATIYLDRKYEKIKNCFAVLSQNSQKTQDNDSGKNLESLTANQR